VQDIAGVVLDHARQVDASFQMVIVGGYRRGKRESGDVDVVLSHPDESKTLGLIEKVVLSLEKGKFITHTLSLSTRNSEREQMPLAWRGEGNKAGSGFDTLDKALVVWHSPSGHRSVPGHGEAGFGSEKETGEKTEGDGEQGTSMAPRRRVDIIVSPWKTVGCAVLGWSGGTTFQRDLRRYCKKERGLKFDSSGIRSRVDGSWMDLEGKGGGWPGPAPDMETAERRVFAGLGLEYRRPEERCTG
jgi:DNA polymerase IV